MNAGLAALKEDGKRPGALSSAELQKTLGYPDYERAAARFQTDSQNPIRSPTDALVACPVTPWLSSSVKR